MPRSGSMRAFNIKRELFGAAGYRALEDSRVLHLDYTDITRRPLTVARRIGDFCAIDPGETACSEITARFDKANVRRLIAETETDILARLRAKAAVDENEIVPLANGQARVMHLATGFQGGHVTGNGDWRHILTAEQRCMIQTTSGEWLTRNGYPEE